MKAYNTPKDELHIESDTGETLVSITPEKTTIANLDSTSGERVVFDIDANEFTTTFTPKDLKEAVNSGKKVFARMRLEDASLSVEIPCNYSIVMLDGHDEPFYCPVPLFEMPATTNLYCIGLFFKFDDENQPFTIVPLGISGQQTDISLIRDTAENDP